MDKNTWVIIGATSVIAEGFAHIAAENGHALVLVGRNRERLNAIAMDIGIRFRVEATIFVCDFAVDSETLCAFIENLESINIFIASSDIVENDALNTETIKRSLTVNTISSAQIINTYWNKKQTTHQLIFLSSVAACRGRLVNSLYAGSKAMVEVYLQGLQQAAEPDKTITIARLGYIDTRQTFHKSGIFYASAPNATAKACWKASYQGKKLMYHPFFWRYIAGVLRSLPFFLFQRITR